jgi:hypothetical protein
LTVRGSPPVSQRPWGNQSSSWQQSAEDTLKDVHRDSIANHATRLPERELAKIYPRWFDGEEA